MELEFDKEIDALLRKARPGKAVLVGDAVKPHLDADELAAFAENALPEKSRALYMAHLADCDNCRMALSNLILLNTEAETETAFVAAPAAVQAAAVPWYRRLLLFPNLAYVMGGLVMIFGGFLGYIALQNSMGGRNAEVTQIEQMPSAASGPNLGEGELFVYSNTNSSSADAPANTSVNTMTTATQAANTASASSDLVSVENQSASGTDVATTGAPIVNEAERRKDEDKNMTLDGVSRAAAPAAAPQPQAKELSKEQDDLAAGAKRDSRLADAASQDRGRDMKSVREMEQANPRSRMAKKSSGPSRDMQNQFPNRAENQYEVAKTRQVGGRTFEQSGSVWYDTAYRGQGTTNVRRGTDAYKMLDGGLRSIAENLGGTIVVVWEGKAYRIQ